MEAIALSLMSGLGFGSAAVLARFGMQGVGPLPSTLISVVVSLVPSLILALIFALSDFRDLPPIALAWFLLLGAVNFLGGRTQSYQAIGRIGASRTGAILSTSAVFATVFAITLTGERPHFMVLIGTAVVVTGLIAALGNSIREGIGSNRQALSGYLMALVAAACYGGTNVIAKGLTETYGSPLMISTISLMFGIILLWPVAGREAVSALRASRRSPRFAVSAGLSGLAAAMGVICLYFALQRADVAVVSPIVSTNPIFTLVLAQVFISRMENLTKQLFLGIGITVMGVALVTFGSTL